MYAEAERLCEQLKLAINQDRVHDLESRVYTQQETIRALKKERDRWKYRALDAKADLHELRQTNTAAE